MLPRLEDIASPILRRLFLYWDARRGEREFPARRDIDPLHFPYALGNVMLIDVLYGPLRFRFRLHGTELALRAGYDMTGKMVDQLPDPENRGVLLARCHALVETRRTVFVAADRLIDERPCSYEAIWLPLSDDGDTITMLMGALVYRDAVATPGRWRPVPA
jgi:hypothetical protein